MGYGKTFLTDGARGTGRFQRVCSDMRAFEFFLGSISFRKLRWQASMNYLIFGIELVVIFLWLFFGPHQFWLALIGVIVIILISQFFHQFLKAR